MGQRLAEQARRSGGARRRGARPQKRPRRRSTKPPSRSGPRSATPACATAWLGFKSGSRIWCATAWPGCRPRGPGFWEQQAARLVDAQIGGLASRVRALAALPGSGADWPEILLAELGRLALAVRAYERIEHLAPALQQALRQYLGFSVREDEVLAGGDILRDRWHVIGQSGEESERVRVQRSWLIGEASARRALLLQFAVGTQPFEASCVPGTAFEAELAFWPGAGAQRALIKGTAAPLPSPRAFPSAQNLGRLLDETASMLAVNPWVERLPAVLAGVVPVGHGDGWVVADAAGQALPLAGSAPWLWLALSGGAPLDVAVEWDGHALVPLGLFLGGRYHLLSRAG